MGPIAFLITQLRIGGAERQVELLAEEFARGGRVVSVLSLKTPDHRSARLERAGVELRTLQLEQWPARAALPGRLRAWLGTIRPAVLHAHLAHADLVGRLAVGVDPALPLVASYHSDQLPSAALRFALRVGGTRVARFTHVSETGYDRFVRAGLFPALRSEVIANAVDLHGWLMTDAAREAVRARLGVQESIVWACLARFHSVKGQLDLLAMVDPLALKAAAATLLFVGDGEDRAACEALVRSRGLANVCRFAGSVADPREVLGACDGLVVPSRSEAMPMAVLEAQAAGLPVVAFEVGGIAELLQHGRIGVLVPAGHHTGLMHEVVRLSADPAERRRLGRAAHARVVARHGIAAARERWEAVYSAVLGSGRRGVR